MRLLKLSLLGLTLLTANLMAKDYYFRKDPANFGIAHIRQFEFSITGLVWKDIKTKKKIAEELFENIDSITSKSHKAYPGGSNVKSDMKEVGIEVLTIKLKKKNRGRSKLVLRACDPTNSHDIFRKRDLLKCGAFKDLAKFKKVLEQKIADRKAAIKALSDRHGYFGDKN